MNQLEHALDLANKGFHVFPLRENSKLPAIKDYPHEATRDVEKIKRWWMDPVLNIVKPFNVGISTDHFGAKDEKLVVVDVDNKGAKKGDEELLKLEMDGFDLPPTMEQITPTGGRHLIYRSKESLKQGVNKLGLGLDIRAKGGYIVGAGSTLEAGEYKLIDRKITDSPAWLISRLGQVTIQEETAAAPAAVNQDVARERAIEYLKQAPVSVEGEGGDSVAYQVAARVKDFGVGESLAVGLMMEHWNHINMPPWAPEDLKAKVRHAYKYGNHPVGISSPEADFTKPEDFKPTTEEKSYLEKINEEYALVYLESAHAILHETVDEEGHPKREFLTEATFKRKFSPFTVQGQTARGKPLSWAEIWLDWEGRREYAGVCFAPERKPRHNYYNLWRGFTCSPLPPEKATPEQRLGLQMFLDHARENVCQNDDKLFMWLMGYFAHLVQRPYERPLTTLVFKGSKGTGKNTLVDRVGNLLGPSHYLVAHEGRYLTSNFNGHLDSCLMLVLDEAFWSGDKAAEGKIKGITTAPKILIERKGREPYPVDNLVRLVVIGNDDWIIPASHDERRYAVFEMGEKRKQQGEYFHKMRVLLDEKGGSGLLLHYFKTFNLKTVDVNKAPSTHALFEQKLRSGTALDQYWYECLHEGHIINMEFGSDEWPERVSKDAFANAFRSYCKERNITQKYGESKYTLGRKLKELCPSIINNQKVKTEDHKQVNAYVLPDLATARKEYGNKIGHEVKW